MGALIVTSLIGAVLVVWVLVLTAFRWNPHDAAEAHAFERASRGAALPTAQVVSAGGVPRWYRRLPGLG